MTKERITSYDSFRGVLLVGMIIFHLTVNLSSLVFNQNYFYWVPLGFMFFLGVVLGQFLSDRPKKVIMLGIKLALIFSILNIPNFIYKNYTISQFLIGDQKTFSFEILLPMSVTIFSSILVNKYVKTTKTALITSAILALILTYLYAINFYSYNLSFLIYGIIGVMLGKNINLDNLSKKIQKITILPVVLVSVAPFFILNLTGILEILIILQVMAIYLIAGKILAKSNFLILLGKHSLLLYVSHIIIIKIISDFYKTASGGQLLLIIPIFLTLCFLTAKFLEKKQLKF